MKILSWAQGASAVLSCALVLSACAHGTKGNTFIQSDDNALLGTTSSGASSSGSSSSSSGDVSSSSSSSSSSTSGASSSSSGGLNCIQPQADCGQGFCTDTSSDPSNCGFCGNICGNGTQCQGSQCRATSACDMNNGDCGGCMNCSVNGVCNNAVNACFADQDCNALVTCIQNCADQTCFDNCMNQHPTGFQLYIAVEQCAICACPLDCVGNPPPNGSCP